MIVAPNVALTQVCGDFTNDGFADVSDLTAYVDFLWKGGPAPVNYSYADIDDYEVITLSDLVGFLRFMFLGSSSPTCPPTYQKIGPIPNPNIYLDLDKKKYTNYPTPEPINIYFVTNKDFVCLDLPFYIKVGNQTATIGTVTIDPVYSDWTTISEDYTLNASGSLLLTFGDHTGNALGPFPQSQPQQLMATVEITTPADPGTDNKIKLVWDRSVPPVVSPYGSSHYPMIITSAWPLKNVMEAYEPALAPMVGVPSLTNWGLIALLVLLLGSTVWVVMRRKKATV